MYQDFSRCASVRRPKRAGWPTESTDEPVDALRRHQRERPGDAGAPVVADDVRLLDAQRVEHRDQVARRCWPTRYASTSAGLSESPKPRRSGAIDAETRVD